MDSWADIFCSRRRCSAEAKQQGVVQRLGFGSRLQQGTVMKDSLKEIKTKIQLMMKRTNIKINSPAMRFSKIMKEMKRNKTAKEPKKQNAGAWKRVALEEEGRVKLDRWMTQPVHKVRTMLPKHPHVIHLQCHRFTMSSIHYHSPCHPLTMPSLTLPYIYHAIQLPCHPFTLSSVHHFINSPCHLLTMSFIHHVIHTPYHPFVMSSIHHVIK